MEKILSSLFLILFIFGCAGRVKEQTTAHSGAVKSEPTAVTPAVETPKTDEVMVKSSEPSKPAPRVGLILSGGGAKAWAHIGVLKEIEKAKWPVQAVAGFEWGAAVAAVYAHRLSANEVEWELSKIKDFENVEENSQRLFEKKAVSDLKVPFVCPSLNIAKQSVFFLNRGLLDKLMPFCLAHPPLSAPYSQSIAEMSDVAGLAQHLRSTGVNKVILVNVLAQNTKRSFLADYLSSDNILWVKSAALMDKRIAGVDEVIQINLDDYGIKDLDKRREIIAKGAELSYNDVKKITSKHGL